MSQLKAADTDSTKYYLSVKDLSEYESKINYGQVRESVSELIGAKIIIRLPNGNDMETTFFSSAEYMEGQGMVELSMDERIRPYFFDLKKNFTAFELHAATSLKGKYSKRIYEMLSQYANVGKFEIDVKELKEKMGIINKKSGKDKYPKWGLFTKRVLDVAEKEMSKYTNLKFDYEPIKVGRKFSRLKFIISTVNVQAALDFSSSSTSKLMQELTQNYKLRRDQAIEVLKRYSVQEIHKIMYEIQLLKSDNKIRNMGATAAIKFDVYKKQDHTE